MPEPSILDLTLGACFEDPITRDTGVTRYEVIEYVRTWMWSKEVMEAGRGFDGYARTGGASRGRAARARRAAVQAGPALPEAALGAPRPGLFTLPARGPQ